MCLYSGTECLHRGDNKTILCYTCTHLFDSSFDTTYPIGIHTCMYSIHVCLCVCQMEIAKLIAKYTCHEHHVISLLIHTHTYTTPFTFDVCCTLQYLPFSFTIVYVLAQPGRVYSRWPNYHLGCSGCWNIIEWDGQWSKSNWNRLYIARERSKNNNNTKFHQSAMHIAFFSQSHAI